MTWYADHPHYLYRLFDEAGALLYIGMTRDFEKRLRLHLATTTPLDARVSGWEGIHARYHHHTIEEHPNAAEAKAAEVAAIGAEAPELNWQHNTKNVKVRPRVAVSS